MAEQVEAAGHSIELRIEDVSQLFHTLDPFPFRERDLDKDAEEFIVSWARELPRDRLLRIVVHLPEAQASLPEAREIGAAITGYFRYRARIIGLDLKELFRIGRWALAIGVAVTENSAWPSRLISKRELLQRVPLSFPTIWKLMRQDKFPRARVIGGKSFWFEHEIDAFLDTLPLRRYKK